MYKHLLWGKYYLEKVRPRILKEVGKNDKKF